MAAAAWVPYAIMAAGTAASMYGQREQNKEQRRILNRSLEETDQAQQRGAEMVLAEAQKMTPAARQQALMEQEAAAFAQSQQDLGGQATPGAGGAVIDTAGSAGNVSKDFVKGQADKALSEGSRLMQVAREAAKVRAPGEMMTREGLGRSQMTGDLAGLFGSARRRANAAGLDAQGVDEPMYGQLGRIASMVGSMWAGGAGAGAGAAGGASGAAGRSTLNTATPRITMFG